MKTSALHTLTTASLLSVAATGVANATPNNPPSFEAGAVPVYSPCDGAIRVPEWALNVTDGDNGTSGLMFRITQVSNPEIFVQYPFVSWPSLTLTYQLRPGTPEGASSLVTAVLQDTSGTGQGGSDTSAPVDWTIQANACIDEDLDGLDDASDPEIVFIDTDGDGLHDAVDLDDDNDGLSDLDEGDGVVDTDDDGIPDSIDTDSDNDGIPDAEETGDSDGDGIPDSQEPVDTDVSTDTDDDGLPDDVDDDDDNDGLTDEEEGNGEVDTDGDGIPDSLDPDSDNDGIGDNEGGDNEGPVVDPQTEDQDGVIVTGVRGGGSLDLALLLLAPLAALRRRTFKR